jgi:hypothetical protein
MNSRSPPDMEPYDKLLDPCSNFQCPGIAVLGRFSFLFDPLNRRHVPSSTHRPPGSSVQLNHVSSCFGRAIVLAFKSRVGHFLRSLLIGYDCVLPLPNPPMPVFHPTRVSPQLCMKPPLHSHLITVYLLQRYLP